MIKSKDQNGNQNRQKGNAGDGRLLDYEISVDRLLPLEELRASFAHLDVAFQGGKREEKGGIWGLQKAPPAPPKRYLWAAMDANSLA